MIGPEDYDFAADDQNEVADDKMPGLVEESDGESDDEDDDGVVGPPPPAEFKKLLVEWARDFERSEAADYQEENMVEPVDVVEEKRIRDAALETHKAQWNSRVILMQYVDDSGDRTLSTIFQDIRYEAQDLTGARNDATRKAARAKNAVDVATAKEALLPDPIGLKAAQNAFAECEDNRTRANTKFAKWAADPLQDYYHRSANAAAAQQLISGAHTLTTPGNKAAKTTKGKPADNVFGAGRLEDAATIISDHPALLWPNTAPQANTITRVEASNLRPGMVVPILRFKHGIPSFANLDTPAAYYVVITDNIDGRIRLVLGHQADDAATQHPQCLLFNKTDMETKRPLVVFTDTGVRTILMDHIAEALRKKYTPLIGPDTTVTQRNDNGSATGAGAASNRESQLRVQKAFIPLRRAVHNDREKLARITNMATELKLSDPALAVNIRNLHSESGIQNLGALRASSIPHLLSFQYSVEPGFTGSAKTPDSLDLSDFMPAPYNGSRYEFRTIRDMVKAFEHLKRVLMGVMLEPRTSKRPMFAKIFQPIIDALSDTDMNTRLDFLHIDFIVRRCNHMVVEWSKLYTNENNEHLPYEEFLALNEAALTIPVHEWLIQGRTQPVIPRQTQIPGKHLLPAAATEPAKKQKGNQPNYPAGNNTPAAGGGGKYGKNPPRNPAPNTPAPRQPAPPAPKPAPEVCIKHLLHQVDAVNHPGDCVVANCPRKHNARQQNGKLSKTDKEFVRGRIEGMTPGPYADKCKNTLDTYL